MDAAGLQKLLSADAIILDEDGHVALESDGADEGLHATNGVVHVESRLAGIGPAHELAQQTPC